MERIVIDLYYLFSVLIIVYGVHWIINIEEKIKLSEELVELLEKDAISPNPLRKGIIISLYKKTNFQILIFYVWTLLGLLTSQSLFFIFIIINEIITLKSTSNDLEFNKLVTRRRIGYIIELILVILIYVNHLFNLIKLF